LQTCALSPFNIHLSFSSYLMMTIVLKEYFIIYKVCCIDTGRDITLSTSE